MISRNFFLFSKLMRMSLQSKPLVGKGISSSLKPRLRLGFRKEEIPLPTSGLDCKDTKLHNNRRWWISNDVMIKLNGACVEIAVINGRKLRFIDGVDCFQKRKPI